MITLRKSQKYIAYDKILSIMAMSFTLTEEDLSEIINSLRSSPLDLEQEDFVKSFERLVRSGISHEGK